MPNNNAEQINQLRVKNEFVFNKIGNSDPDSKSINLFQLGTDTNYADDPEKIHGDTLCSIANTISGSIIVNGPKQSGAQCYNAQEVPAHTVAMLLKDIASKPNPVNRINISAHSRGAMGAVIIAAEFERIKEIFTKLETDNGTVTNKTDIIQKLKASVSQRTSTVFKIEFDDLSDEELIKIKNNIAKLRFNLFLLDPVPGNAGTQGYILGTPATTRWYPKQLIAKDGKFTIPAIVQHAHIQYAQDERTHAFDCAVFESADATDATKTNLTIDSMPGHHGTASGRLRDRTAGADNSLYSFLNKMLEELSDANANAAFDNLKEKVGEEFIKTLGLDTTITPDRDSIQKIIRNIISQLNLIQVITVEKIVDFLAIHGETNFKSPLLSTDMSASSAAASVNHGSDGLSPPLPLEANLKGGSEFLYKHITARLQSLIHNVGGASAGSAAGGAIASRPILTQKKITDKLTLLEQKRFEDYQKLSSVRKHFHGFRKYFYDGLGVISSENLLNGRQAVLGVNLEDIIRRGRYEPLQQHVWLPSDECSYLNQEHRDLALRVLLSSVVPSTSSPTTKESIDKHGIHDNTEIIAKILRRVYTVSGEESARSPASAIDQLEKSVEKQDAAIIQLISSYLLEIIQSNDETAITQLKKIFENTEGIFNQVAELMFTSAEKSTVPTATAASTLFVTVTPAPKSVIYKNNEQHKKGVQAIKGVTQKAIELCYKEYSSSIIVKANHILQSYAEFEKYKGRFTVKDKVDLIRQIDEETVRLFESIKFFVKNGINLTEAQQKEIANAIKPLEDKRDVIKEDLTSAKKELDIYEQAQIEAEKKAMATEAAQQKTEEELTSTKIKLNEAIVIFKESEFRLQEANEKIKKEKEKIAKEKDRLTSAIQELESKKDEITGLNALILNLRKGIPFRNARLEAARQTGLQAQQERDAAKEAQIKAEDEASTAEKARVAALAAKDTAEAKAAADVQAAKNAQTKAEGEANAAETRASKAEARTKTAEEERDAAVTEKDAALADQQKAEAERDAAIEAAIAAQMKAEAEKDAATKDKSDAGKKADDAKAAKAAADQKADAEKQAAAKTRAEVKQHLAKIRMINYKAVRVGCITGLVVTAAIGTTLLVYFVAPAIAPVIIAKAIVGKAAIASFIAQYQATAMLAHAMQQVATLMATAYNACHLGAVIQPIINLIATIVSTCVNTLAGIALAGNATASAVAVKSTVLASGAGIFTGFMAKTIDEAMEHTKLQPPASLTV